MLCRLRLSAVIGLLILGLTACDSTPPALRLLVSETLRGEESFIQQGCAAAQNTCSITYRSDGEIQTLLATDLKNFDGVLWLSQDTTSTPAALQDVITLNSALVTLALTREQMGLLGWNETGVTLPQLLQAAREAKITLALAAPSHSTASAVWYQDSANAILQQDGKNLSLVNWYVPSLNDDLRALLQRTVLLWLNPADYSAATTSTMWRESFNAVVLPLPQLQRLNATLGSVRNSFIPIPVADTTPMVYWRAGRTTNPDTATSMTNVMRHWHKQAQTVGHAATGWQPAPSEAIAPPLSPDAITLGTRLFHERYRRPSLTYICVEWTAALDQQDFIAALMNHWLNSPWAAARNIPLQNGDRVVVIPYNSTPLAEVPLTIGDAFSLTKGRDSLRALPASGTAVPESCLVQAFTNFAVVNPFDNYTTAVVLVHATPSSLTASNVQNLARGINRYVPLHTIAREKAPALSLGLGRSYTRDAGWEQIIFELRGAN